MTISTPLPIVPPAIASQARYIHALGTADPGFVDAVGLTADRNAAELMCNWLEAYMAGVQSNAQRVTAESARGVRCLAHASGLPVGGAR